MVKRKLTGYSKSCSTKNWDYGEEIRKKYGDGTVNKSNEKLEPYRVVLQLPTGSKFHRNTEGIADSKPDYTAGNPFINGHLNAPFLFLIQQHP
jgi:hypothetical protein